MKKVLCTFFFLLSMIAFSQNTVVEDVVTSNGKVISKSKNDKTNKNLVGDENDFINKFYKNQNNIKILDSMMSHRFYRKTPYFKFKKIMEQKNKTFGKFLSKTLINVTHPEKGITIHKYKVNYEKQNTVEEIGLIKESEGDSFEVISYNVSDK